MEALGQLSATLGFDRGLIALALIQVTSIRLWRLACLRALRRAMPSAVGKTGRLEALGCRGLTVSPVQADNNGDAALDLLTDDQSRELLQQEQSRMQGTRASLVCTPLLHHSRIYSGSEGLLVHPLTMRG